jgi:hypothetical protein
MALDATFRKLTHCFDEVHYMVNALHVTIEDKPEYDEAAVVDDLADRTLELLGCIHEARLGAAKARQSLRHPADLDAARRALTSCQAEFHKIERSYAAGLTSYEKLKELARVGRRSAEWTAWANGTKQGIEQCRPPLEQTSEALASCWQELAERLGTMNISVKAIGLVQKIKDGSQLKGGEEAHDNHY